MGDCQQMAEFVFKKNDVVVARISQTPFITRGQRYTVLGVKQLPSREVIIKIAANNKKRKYLEASMFISLEEATSAEEKTYRENIAKRNF